MCYYTDGAPCDSRCVHYPFYFLPHVGPINLSFHSLETSYVHHSAFTPVARPKPIAAAPEKEPQKPAPVEPVPASVLVDPTPVDDNALLELICPTETPYTLFLDPVDVLESPIFKGKVFKYPPPRLLFNLIDKEMQPVTSSELLRFRLSAFTKAEEYQEVECCDRGTAYIALGVLRGTTIRDCINSDLIVFDRLAFNVVSTKIPGHKVILVVHCMNNDQVKPFVIPNVVIRSRSRKTV